MKQKNIFEYKGYHTKVEFDSRDLVLRGKIEGIDDLVNFECQNVQDVEKEFHAAVDDYLTFCEEVGKTPNKEYKGTFNVRISPELHKKLANLAVRNGDTLNATMEKAIKNYIFNGNTTNEYLQDIDVQVGWIKNESKYMSNDRITINGSNIVPFNRNKVLNIKSDKEM